MCPSFVLLSLSLPIVVVELMDPTPEFSRINFPGSTVQIQRNESSPTGYVAVAWQQGLPVACQPISLDRINTLLDQHPHYLIP